MAANMRDLKERIRSAQSTGKITKSMKMVSASKLRRTQNAMQSLRPFAEKSGKILSGVVSGMTDPSNPYLTKREIRRICYVLFVGNRGLCGVYNTALVKYLRARIEQEPTDTCVVVIGRWGRDALVSAGMNVVRTMDEVSDTPSPEDGKKIAQYLKDLYTSGKADEIRLVYEQYLSSLSQVPAEKVLLPVRPKEGGISAADYIFEPDRDHLIDRLVELYIDNTVYSTMLEAKTGEHASRMTAMTAATDNTEELIADLSLKLNHARQAAITTEITEIVSGASALTNH